MGQMIGAVQYIECSAKTNLNVRQVLEASTKAALRKPGRSGRKKGGCSLL
jgi:GTPase SAR1 family protein